MMWKKQKSNKWKTKQLVTNFETKWEKKRTQSGQVPSSMTRSVAGYIGMVRRNLMSVIEKQNPTNKNKNRQTKQTQARTKPPSNKTSQDASFHMSFHLANTLVALDLASETLAACNWKVAMPRFALPELKRMNHTLKKQTFRSQRMR